MHYRRKALVFATAIVLATPAMAQVAADPETAAQENGGDETLWNVLGLLGLLGLVGLRRPSDNDGYTDDPI